MEHEKKLKNLLTKMIGELYYPEYQSTTYEGGDIPTRRTVDKYLPKIKKIFLNDEIKRLKGIKPPKY